jgi:hypothetical protein
VYLIAFFASFKPFEFLFLLHVLQNLIAMELGMLKITGITLFNVTEKKNYDPLPDIEVSLHMLLACYWFFVFISVKPLPFLLT